MSATSCHCSTPQLKKESKVIKVHNDNFERLLYH